MASADLLCASFRPVLAEMIKNIPSKYPGPLELRVLGRGLDMVD